VPLVIDEAELRQLRVSADPKVVGGALVFRGTRVPVDALIDNLEAGAQPRHWRRTLRRPAKSG